MGEFWRESGACSREGFAVSFFAFFGSDWLGRFVRTTRSSGVWRLTLGFFTCFFFFLEHTFSFPSVALVGPSWSSLSTTALLPTDAGNNNSRQLFNLLYDVVISWGAKNGNIYPLLRWTAPTWGKTKRKPWFIDVSTGLLVTPFPALLHSPGIHNKKGQRQEGGRTVKNTPNGNETTKTPNPTIHLLSLGRPTHDNRFFGLSRRDGAAADGWEDINDRSCLFFSSR
jgi:hypothetical protein